MESTPGLDHDLVHTPASAMHSYPSSASLAAHGADQSAGAAGPSHSSSGQQKFSNGPHIRSRITVVCAECKRLKLKCDRRTPCSSCLKRDTVQRCVYSQAAAEKVDVQTLHNRIIEIERVLAQLQAASPSTPVSAVLSGMSSFKQPSPVAGPSRAGPVAVSSSTAALPSSNDRALLAHGASGSSVVINLEDVVSLWLNELEDFGFDPRSSHSESGSSPLRPSASTGTVKLEPTAAAIPPACPSFAPGHGHPSHAPSIDGFNALHPPAPYDAFLPPPSAGPSALPQATAALVSSYLPVEPARARYLKAFRETMLLHPSINVPHFEQRIMAMYAWAEGGGALTSATAAYGGRPMSKQDLARDIFMAGGKPTGSSRVNGTGAAGGAAPNANAPKPTLSFFSAACAAFALGALVARNEELEPSVPSPTSAGGAGAGAATTTTGGDASGTPGMLFALSEQALGLFEKTAAYDLDAVIAMILQVLYMLHEGRTSVAQGVFPMVGKMVNVARMMGLAIDPDEFPGTYNLFEAETRRRVWWEVFYHDVFISDCMGQPPLIADNSHTTHLPADVDEERFTPSCTSLPSVESPESDTSSAYFTHKCRLAQLVKNVKKQTFRDPLLGGEGAGAELSVEQAGAFEADVSTFLQELPPAFRLELTQDLAKPLPPLTGSPFRIAQKCELAILAHRLVVKLYLPFLKEASTTGAGAGRKSTAPSHQAVFGTISAAHNVVYAARVLHGVWGQTRPAVFDFYDFGRTVFDAGVVCAHAVVQEPMSIVAAEGMKSVCCVLDILKDLGAGAGAGAGRVGVEGTRAGAGGAGSRAEAIRIVEAMKRKAEAARGMGGAGVSAGTKRKRGEGEGQGQGQGEGVERVGASASFQLPFVGAAVSSTRAQEPNPRARARAQTTPAGGSNANASTNGNGHGNGDAKGKPEAKKQAREKEREKEKAQDREKSTAAGTSKFINGPLRVRPMTGQPTPRRQRTASVSTAAGATPAPTAPPPPKAAPPPAPTPSPLTTTPPSGLPSSSSRASVVSIPESPSVATPYEAYGTPRAGQECMQPPPQPPSVQAPQQPQQAHQQQQQQQEDYAMQYSSPDDGLSVSDDRRFSYDSPPSAATTMYEHPHGHGHGHQQQTQGSSQYASPVTAYPPPPPPPGQVYTSYLPYAPPTGGYETMGVGMVDAAHTTGVNGPPNAISYTQVHPQSQHASHHAQYQAQVQAQHGQRHPQHPGHGQPHPHPSQSQHGQHGHQQAQQQPQQQQQQQQQPPPMGMLGWPQQSPDPGAGPNGEMWQDFKFYGV